LESTFDFANPGVNIAVLFPPDWGTRSDGLKKLLELAV
jgi:hypothetical protein